MVLGVAELHRRFEKIPEKVRRALTAEMEVAAKGIVAQMKSIAPVGSSGALRRSIGWTWGDVPAGSLKIGTFRGGTFGKLKITIYAGKKLADDDAFYARFVEFGTSKTPAQPFFFPVYRANRDNVKRRLQAKLRKALKDA